MPSHPERILPLAGASNFRDLGGYRGRDGRALRWRLIFRSDHLAGLTAADRALLQDLGLAYTLDFRGVQERAAQSYSLPGVAQHSLAIEPSVSQQLQALQEAGGRVDAAAATGLMQDLYRSLVDQHAPRYAELFQHLLHGQGPLVFHCTAGKDRTGWAAALILLALGVPREVVMADFLITQRCYRHPPLAPSATPLEALQVMWGVQPSFLEAALHWVDSRHGGIEHYLQDRLGLGPAALDALAARCLQQA
ncbi:tyrosine-protein phosphatase [Rubrivivax sp. A210]|uniref:tyrosine-protein phosphatase n=1 Tax=Rubrivivax sp. A210 TaxID=2772301 RepID=UPI00191982FB|nr:tyrosine-protein phosphatase [Rubrivivax sp. A210]